MKQGQTSSHRRPDPIARLQSQMTKDERLQVDAVLRRNGNRAAAARDLGRDEETVGRTWRRYCGLIADVLLSIHGAEKTDLPVLPASGDRPH